MRPKGLLGRLRGLFRLLAIILLLLGVVFCLRNDFWRVERVSCHLNGDPCSPNLWAELVNETSGKNILFLSPAKISAQVEENHPEFFQVQTSKQLPHGLLFEIKARRTVVAIGKEEGDFYLVDKDGVILEKTEHPADLPLVLIIDDISQSVGKKIQTEVILKQIQILHQSQLRLLEPKSTRVVSERTIEAWFKDDLQVLFSTQKEAKEQLDSLQFILERTKIEGEKPKRIDLRFDKPVIVK